MEAPNPGNSSAIHTIFTDVSVQYSAGDMDREEPLSIIKILFRVTKQIPHQRSIIQLSLAAANNVLAGAWEMSEHATHGLSASASNPCLILIIKADTEKNM